MTKIAQKYLTHFGKEKKLNYESIKSETQSCGSAADEVLNGLECSMFTWCHAVLAELFVSSPTHSSGLSAGGCVEVVWRLKASQ